MSRILALTRIAKSVSIQYDTEEEDDVLGNRLGIDAVAGGIRRC